MCDRLPWGFNKIWVRQVRQRARVVEFPKKFWTRYQIKDGSKVLGVGPSEVQAWNNSVGAVSGEIDAFALRQSLRLERQGWTRKEIGDKCMNDFFAFSSEQYMCFIGRHLV